MEAVESHIESDVEKEPQKLEKVNLYIGYTRKSQVIKDLFAEHGIEYQELPGTSPHILIEPPTNLVWILLLEHDKTFVDNGDEILPEAVLKMRHQKYS